MFKKEKVVMLPINEKAENCLAQYYNGKMSFSKPLLTESYRKAAHVICYHLYVISNDEKLESGDWFIVNDIVHKCIGVNKVSEDIESNNGLCYDKTKCKKIIAPTDSSLTKVVINGDFPVDGIPLPKPSQSFIEKYIECYNKGEIIDDVMVEYEWDKPFMSVNEDEEMVENYPLNLKINPKDNTITIKKIKNSWNREELDDMLSQQAAATASQILEKFKGYKSREEVVKSIDTLFSEDVFDNYLSELLDKDSSQEELFFSKSDVGIKWIQENL